MFNNSKLQRAKKRTSFANENTAEDSPNPRKMPRRSPVPSECFLCEKLGQPSQLRHAMMQELNDRVKECALTLSDGKLLAKLSGGDVVALELKYHSACLVALYNRKRAYLKALSQKQSDQSSPGKEVYPLAFSELVIYITETRNASEGTSPAIFRLADLTKVYKERLEQLGVELPNVCSNRLKDQLMAQMPDME